MSLDIESRKRGREDQEDGGDKRQRRPQPELRLALEQEKVSHVIGKGGAVIKNIIKQSGAYIKFAPVKEGTTRQVGHISGNADCIGLAIELLTYQLAKYQTPEAKTLPALTLLVATPQIGLIIGKAGQIVRSVQSQSGARVQISPRPDASADGSPIDQDVAIFGSSQSVAAAARILISYLFRQTVTPQAAYPVAATPFGLAATPYWPAAAAAAISTAPPLGSDELEVRFALNPGEVSRIIGKGGSGIQSITKSSRVKLVFDKSVQPAIGGAASGRVQIGTVRGEGANIIKSLEMVIQTISAKPDRDSSVAEVSDEKRAGPLRFLLMIPSPVIGFLLGTKGAKIKETKEKSGASINITGRGDAIWDHVTGVALQAVVVEGDADQVTTAIRLVVQQLDESRQAPRRRGGSSSEAEVV